jgi:adenine-specific DNA-methyltransferase
MCAMPANRAKGRGVECGNDEKKWAGLEKILAAFPLWAISVHPLKKARFNSEPEVLRDEIATAEVLFSLGQSEAQAMTANLNERDRIGFAQSLCTSIMLAVWEERRRGLNCDWEIRKPLAEPVKRRSGLLERIAGALGKLSTERSAFLVGRLYTALLPEEIRRSLGAYYTPPPLAARLIELVESTGLNWRTARVVDPSCGGAAFLASVAPGLCSASQDQGPLAQIESLEERLVGIEIDRFAAWLSMVLVDLTLFPLSIRAGRMVKNLVLSQDAFDVSLDRLGTFDLVIGNPPYGKITLPPDRRERFKASLFGHANLYGLFTELALRLIRPGGLIAYVTPTSILGGEYFKNLRKLLAAEAPLRRLDFVSDREGVFDGVLQETMLTVYKREARSKSTRIHVSSVEVEDSKQGAKIEIIGSAQSTALDGMPWVLPRSGQQVRLVSALSLMPRRLEDYGFAVSTGQLVWNRHKDQLRATYDEGCLPIIWAEAVNPDGTFHFQAARRTHLPYLKAKNTQDFLVNHEPCILVQRTTAKEQKRRLIAAVIPNSFVAEYPGFIVENHLNMVYAVERKPRFALRTIAALLNSEMVDKAFRCINGSVAVSAYELNSLQLPSPTQMAELQAALFSGTTKIEALIERFYSTPDESAGNHSSEQNRRMAA